MVNPSMYISHEDQDGVVLHYRTSREGFSPYLKGIYGTSKYNFFNID